jgi:hypothetical protein
MNKLSNSALNRAGLVLAFLTVIQAAHAGIDVPITPVPEPSTYGLIGVVALIGLAVRRHFKK